MKQLILLITTLLLSTFAGFAQQKGYEIVGDSVVFTFDLRDYDEFTDDVNGKKIEAEDLAVESVTLAGQFNDWSRQGWQMKQISVYEYRLTRPLKDLQNQIEWEFKYLVNATFWAEPDRSFDNIIYSEKSNFWNSVYNLQLYTLAPDPNGNTTFTLEGHEEAKQVILTGSFNQWDEQALNMQKTSDGWALTLNLSPGTHAYKFIIDGDWTHDKRNPEKVYNEFGGYNSVIEVLAPTVFRLPNFRGAKEVYLAGTFNDWNSKALPMKQAGDHWEVCIDLKGGKHQYKYVVDGEWILDPENELKEYDTYGHLNSVIMIE